MSTLTPKNVKFIAKFNSITKQKKKKKKVIQKCAGPDLLHNKVQHLINSTDST